MTTIKRDGYKAIVFSSLPDDVRQLVLDLVEDVSSADKVDEHGGWDFGIGKISRSRSRSLNWDLYGISTDVHSSKPVAVIQVREWTQGGRWNTVRKSYFLIGRNEDGSAFAHPVSHGPIFAAIRAGRDVVLACQNWIFGGDYEGMIRQGDVVMVKMKKRPGGTKGQLRRKVRLESSHKLTATQIADVDGRIYAKNPKMTHVPGTHPDIGGRGWYRVIVGRRADFWNFAAPTID